jgi:hypothetical protein
MPTDTRDVDTCARCQYWQRAIPDQGECHRYPPGVDMKDDDQVSMWPFTADTDWCGEFAEAEREG